MDLITILKVIFYQKIVYVENSNLKIKNFSSMVTIDLTVSTFSSGKRSANTINYHWYLYKK